MLRPDTEGLHPIANTDRADRVADIVFVHGLGGRSHATWRHGKAGEDGHFFWPEELGREFLECGIWSFGYGAGAITFGKKGMPLGKQGLNLADQLVLNAVGVSRPLIFIVHSMGGLLVKAMIDGCQVNVDPRMVQFAKTIKGIAFFGTPHLGSAIASAAAIIRRFIPGIVQKRVAELAEATDELDLLHGRFLGWVRQNPAVQVHCFAEMEGLWQRNFFGFLTPVGLVVNNASAVIHTFPNTFVGRDHFQLVKPEDRRSHSYLGSADFVRRILPGMLTIKTN